MVGLMVLALVVPADGAGVTTCVSVASNGRYANDGNSTPAVSGNGRYVGFAAYSSNLVPGDTNNRCDVFVHDRRGGRTTRVSVASGGTQANDSSGWPAINGDGRYVAFHSIASNLVGGDTNGQSDAFVRDRSTGQTSRVSVATDGTQGNDYSGAPALSRNGRYVAFNSGASNLVAGDTNGWYDIFFHDRVTGHTTRVSLANDGSQANGYCEGASISGNGHYVAFASGADNLVTGDTNGIRDVFVRERWAAQTRRVSVASDGTEADGPSEWPSISADGRYVVFASDATNLVAGDTNGEKDMFLHDLWTGQTTRVSVASDGSQANGSSDDRSSISGDGRYAAFRSSASNLVSGDTNSAQDVFLHDRQTGQTTRVSVATDGSEGAQASYHPSVSADGRYVAFTTYSFGAGPYSDIFVRDRLAGALPDMWIKARGDWAGDDIHNTTGRGQTQGRVLAIGDAATYRLAIQNDGSEASQFVIRGTGGTPDWQVQYFNRGTGGADITAQVTGAGYQTPSIAPGALVIGRLEVTPLSGATVGNRYTVAVSASPLGDPTRDVVKANTTGRAVPTSPQIASLTAVPTAGGAEVVFSLSGAATVTASVRNLAGRSVKTICSVRECEAGANTLLWNAQSENGLPVPNGRYLIQLVARTSDGTESRALAAVRLER